MLRWLRSARPRGSHRGEASDPGAVPLPRPVAEALLAMRELEGLRQRRAMIPGASLPERATLAMARQGGLHPSVDPIGHRARAALAHWGKTIGGEAPQVVAAWAGEDTASILLAGPLDPAVGVPGKRATALGVEVSLRQYGGFKPDTHHQLVLAEVAGHVDADITPDPTWAADGLLVPFGSTKAGVLYLPLLGPQRAGPMCLSGPAAADLLASIVIFALARVGPTRARALVYQDLLPHIDGLIEAETFGPAELGSLRERLEEEWKARAVRIIEAGAEGIHDYALLPDAEPIPLLLLIIGAQAATELGLLDPDWPYVLQGAGRKGMPILVWGDVPTAPRRVHASATEAGVLISASDPLIEIDIPELRFTPALLSPEVRNETAAILNLQVHATRTSLTEDAAQDRRAQHTDEAHAIAPEQDSPPNVAPLAAETADEQPQRRLFVLGGARAEYAGVPVEGWRRRHALELLAFLAAHPEGRSADAVSEALWPDAQATRARTRLRQLVREARLRLAGDPDRAPVIVYRDGIYRLDWNDVWADVEAFRRAIAAAAQASDPLSDLREAAALYRGELCKDTYYSWAEPIRQELERSYVRAVIRLADLLLDREALEDAQRILDDALALNPYVDALVQRAIIVDARQFGLRAARERLDAFRVRLRKHLDVDPDPSTIDALEHMTRELSADP